MLIIISWLAEYLSSASTALAVTQLVLGLMAIISIYREWKEGKDN